MKTIQLMGLRLRSKALLSVILLAYFGAGCGSVPPEYETFLELPSNQQRDELRKFPPEKQLEYYFAGLKYMHPGNKGLADVIAERGKSALPFLIDRLRKEKSERNKAEIIFIFEVMHVSYYNLKDEGEVLSLLEETKADAEWPELRRKSEEALKLIRENKAPDPIELLDKKSS